MSVHVDKTLNPERRTARRTLIAAVLAAGLVGLVGGAVGGAAGAMWVVQTMAAPKFSPKARNAVVEYAGMPAEGARPVDIAGLTRSGTPLHPCLVDFLEEQREVVGEADWRKVRLHPFFKNDEDIVNQLAFSSGAYAITRGNDIYVNIPYTPSAIDQLGEELMFHELVHVAQYASGMSLPEYASSAARSYAEGARPEDNAYENEARDKARELLRLWALSPQRVQCHPDQREAPHLRAPSERPEISFAIFSSEKGEYELVRHQLHKNRLLVREIPPVEAGSETEAG
jgi:hypothetical protein